MLVTTFKSNFGECPLWDVDVAVRCWYGEKEPGVWSFLRAECPIIENSKRPLHEQEQQYKLMFCKDKFSCPLYTGFQPTITPDK